MKKLYLIRHAKSSWKDQDLADLQRPLNKRGKRDTSMMGKHLKKSQVKPDLIISSPAKRALKTAKIIAREIGYPKEKIVTKDFLYVSGVQAMLNVIQYLDDSLNEVMLFGHNPDLTSLANSLTNHRIDNIPTCGIFCKEKGFLNFSIIRPYQIKKILDFC